MKLTATIFIVLATLLMTGCDSDDYYNRKTKISGEAEQKQLVERLKKDNVRFWFITMGMLAITRQTKKK